MENLIIDKSKYTPQIEYNAATGNMVMRGRSYPENTYDFYDPVFKWIRDYFNDSPKEKTVFIFDINYLNSTSSKLFYDLFDALLECQAVGFSLVINWEYDEKNENAEEAGEGFQEDFGDLEFNLVKK